MLQLGYMYKRVAQRPESLNAEGVSDIFSLSGCISENFADYINFWRHNGYWLFDSPAIIESLAQEHSISLQGMQLFYFEAFPEEFDDDQNCWAAFSPEASFETHVQAPEHKTLEGFDVTSFSTHNAPECSLLSCNGRAETIPTNSHCLFRTFEEARAAIEDRLFEGCEPGPYRIIAVYTVDSLV